MSSVIRQFFRNAASMYASTVIGLTITFFFTPYLAAKLGTEVYGVWTLIFSITKYMEMSDLGMRQSMVRGVSQHYAVRNWPKVNEVYSTTSVIYAFTFPVIMLATVVVAYGFLDQFQIPDYLFEVTRTALLLIGLNTALHFLFLPFISMGPLHRFDVGSYTGIVRTAVQALGMVILLEMHFGLVAMAVYVIAINLAEKFTLFIIRRRLFPEIHFSKDLASRQQARELLSYSLVSFLIIVAIVVIHNTDTIIIGLFLSMQAVAVYSVPAMIILQLRGLTNALATVLVPTISHLDSLKDSGAIGRLYARSTRYLYYICTALGIGIALFGSAFLLLWMGKDFEEGGAILNILALPACLMFPQLVAQSILLGISRHKLTLYVLVAEALANVVLSLMLVQKFGIVGVAVGTAIPQAIIYGYVFPRVFLKELNLSMRVFYTELLRSVLMCLVCVLPPGLAIRLLLPPTNWATLFIGVGICVPPILAGFYYLVLLPEDQASMRRWVGEKLRRAR